MGKMVEKASHAGLEDKTIEGERLYYNPRGYITYPLHFSPISV